MIKKYHIGDLFTLSEVVLACTLIVLAFFEGLTDIALWIFIAGELCDALDGPCARRWHYPDDGKRRWWRQYNTQIDQLSDILLAVACAVYLIAQVNTFFGAILTAVIFTHCFIVQLYVDYVTAKQPQKRYSRKIKRIILMRRYVYVFVGIGGAIVLLIWHTTWAIICKALATGLLALSAIILAILKRNRLKEVTTSL